MGSPITMGTMEDTLVGRYCLTKLDELIAVVAALSDEEANTVPDLPGANSAYQLLTHCLGMAHQWAHEHILDEPTGRDRDAEFEADGNVADLVTRAAEAREQFRQDLARMRPEMGIPGRPGREEFWADSVEGVLLHVLEELCQHLGHLEITRDLVATPAGDR